MTKRRRAGLLAGLGLAAWLAAAAALDSYGHRPVKAGRYDAIIVAGCRVWPGGVPSPALAMRTRRGVDLWRRGVAPRLVFTGGVGTVPPAESVVAANLARQLGVPDDAILVEQRSTSTEGNAREAAAVLGRVRVVVVTDYYHVFRCERVFRRYFAAADGAGSWVRWQTRLKGGLREVPLLAYYALRRRI